LASKQKHKTLAFVKKISSCNGAYRGIIQIPAHLGIVLALNSIGIIGSKSITDTLFWVWAFPRFFSVPLEIFGGFLSQTISSRGSFICLPFGIAIRAISLLLMMMACTSTISNLILILGATSVCLGEIGRSLFTCQYQDIINQIVKDTKLDHLFLISKCETVEKNSLHIFRIIFAAIGTASVVLFHIFRQEDYSWIFFSPYIVSIGIHFVAFFESIRWASIKRSINIKQKHSNLESVIFQAKHFIKSKNVCWSLGAGGFIFLYIYLVNFAVITSGIFTDHDNSGSLNVYHALYASTLAILPPMAAWSSNFIILKKSSIKFQSLGQGYLGIILLSLWFILLLISEVFGINSSYRIIWVFSFAFLFGPLQTWIGWQRIPILSKAESEKTNRELFYSSHVFYYALISSTMELAIGIFGLIIKFTPLTQLNFSLLFIGLCSIFLTLVWKLNFKKSSILEK